MSNIRGWDEVPANKAPRCPSMQTAVHCHTKLLRNKCTHVCASWAQFAIRLQYFVNIYNKKAVLSQRWPRNAPYRPTWVPWKISGIPDYAHGYYSQHFSWAFVRIDSMNVPTKFEVRSFTRSWDNRGYPKIWALPGYAHAPFSPKFSISFYSDCPCKCTRQIWSP